MQIRPLKLERVAATRVAWEVARALRARATWGYVEVDPAIALLSKTQPLSLRRAMSEADFMEAELRGLAPEA